MWVGEVLDGDNIVQRYYFKFGKICKLGRAVENHISFPADKSISRVHAEISTMSSSSIKVTDLGSSFGTLLNGEKLIPKKEYVIDSNSVVQFGAMISKIRFTREQISLCLTRLDKDEKDRVKKNAKQINAKIVTIADHATHVVTNRCTATIKLLTAVVLNLKIVTVDWLISLAETDEKNPVAVLPKEADYFPPSGDEAVPVNVVDPSQSRGVLFKKVVVLVLNEDDMQYAVILNACGATVKQVDAPTAEAIQKLVVQLSGDKSAAPVKTKKTATKVNEEEDATTVCIFFDESKGIPAPKHLTSAVQPAGKSSKIPVKWLTIHQLAVSVMSLTPPVLLTDPPAAVVRAGSLSTSGGDGSQSQALISHYFEGNRSHRVDSNATVMEEDGVQPPAASTAKIPVGIAAVVDVPEDEEEYEVTKKAAASAKKGRSVKTETVAPTAVSSLPPLPPAGVAASSAASSKRKIKDVAGGADEVRSVASSHDGGAAGEEAYSSPVKKPRRGGRAGVSTPETVPLPAAPLVKDVEEIEKGGSKRQKTSNTTTSIHASSVTAAVKAEPGPSSVSQETPAVAAKVDNKRKRTTGTAADAKKSSALDSSLPQSYNADTPASLNASSSSYFPVASSSFFSESAEDAADDGDDADWLPVLRGVARMQVLQTKRANTLIARQQEQEDHDSAAADSLLRSQASDSGVTSGRVKTESRSSASAARKKISGKADLAEGLSDDEETVGRDVPASSGVSSSIEFTQPVVVESNTLFNPERLRNPRVIGGSSNSNSSSSNSSAPVGRGLKNMKRFQKNYCRAVPAEEMLLSRSMDRVLPKESERELQLRLELESAMEKENQAEQLFSDRFGATGGSKARAR